MKATIPYFAIALLSINHVRAPAVEAYSTLPFGLNEVSGDVRHLWPGYSYADIITTGPSATTLESITLQYSAIDPSWYESHEKLRIRIFKAPFGLPSPDLPLVAEFGGGVIDPTPTPWFTWESYVKFSPTFPIALEPNTAYWFVAHNPPDSLLPLAVVFNLSDARYSSDFGWSVFGLPLGWGPEFFPESFFCGPLRMKIEVNLPNQSPDCSTAQSSLNVLWPPDNEFHEIRILGVTDPDGDPVRITVTGITQDEPLQDGAPDAMGIGTDTATLRAERLGEGNGRVYRISFTASDYKGGQCDGSVLVTIPHDESGSPAIDDGQNYDSTAPD